MVQKLLIKIGTPTMEVVILIGFFWILLWSDLKNSFNWFLIFIVFSFGLLGAFDDIKKIRSKSSDGMSSKTKFLFQIIISLIGIIILTYIVNPVDLKNLYVPFFKSVVINLGWFFIPFYLFVIIGSSNEVNLTIIE